MKDGNVSACANFSLLLLLAFNLVNDVALCLGIQRL